MTASVVALCAAEVDHIVCHGRDNRGSGFEGQRRNQIGSISQPGWRNGRRGGFKIRCPYGRVGSSPTPGTLQTFQRLFVETNGQRPHSGAALGSEPVPEQRQLL